MYISGERSRLTARFFSRFIILKMKEHNNFSINKTANTHATKSKSSIEWKKCEKSEKEEKI